jgi:hypothetical protein
MLLKKDVHEAYSAFCVDHRFETTTNAAFGKMFKRVFPTAGTSPLLFPRTSRAFEDLIQTMCCGQRSDVW